ncbi:MAG: FtsX-like permease family protein [Rectinemataceae bacterium]
MIVARIAFRNLFLHKAKTALIGTIMCLGIMVLFVGNSLIDTAIGGLRRMFVQGYTGDLMITGPTAFPVTIFGETAGGEETIPHIAKLPDYRKLLDSRADVTGTMPMLTGSVEMGIGETLIGQGSMFGVDIGEYRKFFSDNISLVSGSWPEEGNGAWILLSEQSVAMLSRSAGSQVGPGSKITLSALGESAGTVIREVEVKGVIRYGQSDSTLAKISLCDSDTMRDLLGFASLRDGAVVLSEEEAAFVESFDPEALFATDTGIRVSDGNASIADPFRTDATPGVDDAFASSTTPEAGTVAAQQPDPAWQFLLVKLADSANPDKVMVAVRTEADRLGQNDRVQDWVESAGSTARTAQTVRLVFDLLVSIVAVVVVIITMNTLVVSVSERIPEIGTLRAIGARRAFVRRMILLETTFLAVIAGALGLVLGGGILLILGQSGITAPNLFFEALFGGKVLIPQISIGAALRAFVWILAMSLVSSLYPTAVALRIKPVVAMQGD